MSKVLVLIEKNNFYNINCLDGMSKMDDNIIDLTITSPPYDDLRMYDGGSDNFPKQFKKIAKELFRITKEGGVLVWVVGDSTKDFCESLTSFKQAIYFVEGCGFKLLDTMIYKKRSYAPAYPTLRRYASVFEYMFVFSKGKPKTFNELKEAKLESSIQEKSSVCSFRQKNGELKKVLVDSSNRQKAKTNVWEYLTGNHCNDEDREKFKHPATFPNKLVEEHILSWSNKGDLIFDPMCGSGTTIVMAKKLRRNYIGFEHALRYMGIIKKRMAQNLLIQPEVNKPSLSQNNKKEDGFPPTPKGMGIQPTIL